MKKRIEWIDLCKIITMIIVCYDHTIQSIAPDEALKNSFFIGTISFHMPLFRESREIVKNSQPIDC